MRDRDPHRRRRRLLQRQPVGAAACGVAGIAPGYAVDLEAFSQECGLPPGIHLRIDDALRSAPSRRVPFAVPFAVVGAGEECDVRLAAPNVSAQHAYLQLVDGGVFCCDLGSRGGTYWTEHRRTADWIGSDDAVSIGPYTLRLEGADFESPQRTPSPLARSRANRPRDYSLQFLNDSHSDTPPWRLDRPVTLIGRNEQCKVRLTHRTVEDFHCSIVHTAGGVWIVDLLAGAGTYVNGRRRRVSRLFPGDEVGVGRFLIRIVERARLNGARDLATACDDAAGLLRRFAWMQQLEFDRAEPELYARLEEQLRAAVGEQAEPALAELRDLIARFRRAQRSLADEWLAEVERELSARPQKPR